ncbi:MAG: hypothetical protein V1851_00440 [Patescibacteria group bacterium]
MKKTKEFFQKHEIFFITTVILITITRISVSFKNPNPSIFGFELHHFDYGLFLLIGVQLAIIFGNISRANCLIFSGIAIGLIIDDYWFIRSNIIDPSINEITLYQKTLPTIFIPILISILISIFFWKKQNKPLRPERR